MSDIQIRENVSLAPLTSFEVGGAARWFAEVADEDHAASALGFARARGLKHLILGGGSNVLISDEGFDGLVILNRIKGMKVEEEGERVRVTAGAGEDWQEFADFCVTRGWQGVECLAGIPGTVGAAPIQNIGAYGCEVSQAVEEVRCLDTACGKTVTFHNTDCLFRYRGSIFNTGAVGRYVVLSVTFNLIRGGHPAIMYRELEERLKALPYPTLADVRDAVISIRASKGVLIRSGYESWKSAGSFFKNPIVGAGKFEEIRSALGVAATGWAWPLPDGEVKISAAYLIQCAGFERGYRDGNVGLSPYHTLIVVNFGGASAGEIVDFAAKVQLRVKEQFGLSLHPEARIIGFDRLPGDLG